MQKNQIVTFNKEKHPLLERWFDLAGLLLESFIGARVLLKADSAGGHIAYTDYAISRA